MGTFANGLSQCVSACEDKFYEDTTTRTCLACKDECATCLAYEDCDTCIVSPYEYRLADDTINCICASGFRVLSELTCVATCAGGTYPDTITLYCELCHNNCALCVGNQNT